jgi:hypothetical protein
MRITNADGVISETYWDISRLAQNLCQPAYSDETLKCTLMEALSSMPKHNYKQYCITQFSDVQVL